MVRLDTIVCHEKPHLSDLAAIWALQAWGEERYPGCADVLFVPFNPAVHLDGRTEEEWQQDGVLFIGVRGGKFDDHPHDRFPHDCEFTLMVRDLGRSDDPALRELQRYILTSDRRGSPHHLHLESLVKVLHRLHDTTAICRMVMPLLEAFYLQQYDFQQALEIAQRNPPMAVWHKPTRTVLQLAVFDGIDHVDLGRAAREEAGGNAALVIQRNSRSQYYIAGNVRLGVCDLSALAAYLQALVLREQGVSLTPAEIAQLGGDGVHPKVPHLYHQKEAAQILNGSLTAPSIEPLPLSLRAVLAGAVKFLSRVYLGPRNPSKGERPTPTVPPGRRPAQPDRSCRLAKPTNVSPSAPGGQNPPVSA